MVQPALKHDPMCPTTDLRTLTCRCDLIARVRADERAQAATRMYLQRQHISDDLRAKVEALPRTGSGRMGSGFVTMPGDGDTVRLSAVLALIDGDSDD